LLGGGYADCQAVYGEQTARDELVAGLNHMDAAVVTLDGEIEPRVRSDLRDAIKEVKERARRHDDFCPREEDRMVLSSEGDRALAPGTGLRKWYNFGATLGRYHYTALGLQYGAPPPKFAAVLASARHVLEDGAAEVPVLKRLVSSATEPKTIRVRKLLCRTLSEYRFEKGAYPQVKLDRAIVCVLLGKLHDLLIRQLLELTRTEAPSGANANGAETPVWDEVRSVLTWRGDIIRQFRAPAKNQKDLIEAFHRANWGRSIPDPFRDRRTLDKTVTDLNKQLRQRTIRFRLDGTGEGVNWEPTR
jgi:hypothetical protein